VTPVSPVLCGTAHRLQINILGLCLFTFDTSELFALLLSLYSTMFRSLRNNCIFYNSWTRLTATNDKFSASAAVGVFF